MTTEDKELPRFFVEYTTPDTGEEWIVHSDWDEYDNAESMAIGVEDSLEDEYGAGECSVRVNERGSFELQICKAGARRLVRGEITEFEAAREEACKTLDADATIDCVIIVEADPIDGIVEREIVERGDKS